MSTVSTSTYHDAVDELQRILNGIPDRPSLKLMTFDDVKQRLSSRPKDPKKRQHTYAALKEKLEALTATLAETTLDAVDRAGGVEAYRNKFAEQSEELSTALKVYQKRHRGKKAKAVEPLHGEIESLRVEMNRVLDSLGTQKDLAFGKQAGIETVAQFRQFDEVLASSFDMVSSFRLESLTDLTMTDLTVVNGKVNVQNEVTRELNKLRDAIVDSNKGDDNQLRQALLNEIDELGVRIAQQLDEMLQNADVYPANMRLADVKSIKPGQLKGVCLRHCKFDEYNSSREVPPPKAVLGKGNVNEVMQINYGDGAHVFKEEKPTDGGSAFAPAMIGIDKKNDPRYGNRNVASGLVSSLLGSSVIDPCTFAINGGQVGLLMNKAEGKNPSSMRAEKLIHNRPIPLDNLSDKAMASLQKQLMQLEACDLIMGQVDRHHENYMIDVKGDEVTVKGIDNDFCFGNSNFGGVPLSFPFAFRNIPNMPKLLDSEMANNIEKIDFDKDIAPQLVDLLKQDELAAAKERIEAMQKHVAQLRSDGCIVEDWLAWRSKEGLTVNQFLAPQDGKDGSSYFARDIHKLVS